MNKDKMNKILWIVLNALVPPLGIVMYIRYRKDQKLQEASSVGFAAVIGTVIIASIVIISSVDDVSGVFKVLSYKNLVTGFSIFFGLILLFTHQSLSVAIADKKGQNKTIAGSEYCRGSSDLG